MRLGTQTGSLISHVLTSSTQPAPTVGMAATLCGWSDRHPATVVEAFYPATGGRLYVTVQEDHAKVPAGASNAFTEMQTWEYSANPDGYRTTYRQTKDGRWEEVRKGQSGRWVKTGGKGLVLGRREKYVDPTF